MVIAVIDSGVDKTYLKNSNFIVEAIGYVECNGDISRTEEDSFVYDEFGHGTMSIDCIHRLQPCAKILSVKVLDTQEFLANAHSYSASGLVDSYICNYNKTTKNLLDSTMNVRKILNIHSLINGIITIIGLALILFVSNLKISLGLMTYGTLVIFIRNYSSVSNPILNMINLKTDIQEIKPSVERIINNTSITVIN